MIDRGRAHWSSIVGIDPSSGRRIVSLSALESRGEVAVGRASNNQDRPILQQRCRVPIAGLCEAPSRAPSPGYRVVQFGTAEGVLVESSRDQDLAIVQQRCTETRTGHVHAPGQTPGRAGAVVQLSAGEEARVVSSRDQDLAIVQQRCAETRTSHVHAPGQTPGPADELVQLSAGERSRTLRPTASYQDVAIGQQCRRVTDTGDVEIPRQHPRWRRRVRSSAAIHSRFTVSRLEVSDY